MHILLLILLSVPSILLGQAVSGYVLDEENTPVPYCRVQIKEADVFTVTDADGFFSLQLEIGEYELVFTSIGFEDQVRQIVTQGEDIRLDVYMAFGKTLREAEVKANRRDPAYAIMKQASDRRRENDRSVQNYRCDVYIKASEEVVEEDRKKNSGGSGMQDEDAIPDAFKDEEVRNADTSRNMAEVILVREYLEKGKLKETRKGIRLLGDTRGLYYLSTVEEPFNFYENMLRMQKLVESALISPLNTTAVLHYKFELEEKYFDGDRWIYRIGVKPRNRGNSMVEGTIWILDSSFAIHKLDFELEKRNLKLFDRFRIFQEYEMVGDTMPVMVDQRFEYGLDTRKRDFDAYTEVHYSNFEFDITWPDKYFNNELGRVEIDAYEKDSSYWEMTRPEPLTREEQEYQRKQDSIHYAHSKKEYLDSVDREFNRITWEKVLYLGISHRNREKKSQWEFGSLLNYIEPVNLGGFRVDPYAGYFKEFENEQWLLTWGRVSYGFTNNDIIGQGRAEWLYDPMHLGRLRFEGGYDYDAFNPYTSFVTAFQTANYFRTTNGEVEHLRELFNGFVVNTVLSFDHRSPLTDFDFGYTGRVSDQWFGETDPIDFEPNQAFRSVVTIKYTPAQKFIREPYRKVVLGSKWPTFYVQWERGWKGLFSSDVDFDYVAVGMEQTFSLYTLGNSKYRVLAGKFVNSNALFLADYKFFRWSEPWFFSNPMRSFQLLDTSIFTTDLYFEGHYLHHFNGALLTKVPLIRKTGIRTVAGGGAMYLPNGNFFHAEIMAGMERIFRIGRVRFRLGAYYAVPTRKYIWYEGFKFSLEFYNNAKGKWRF